MTTGQGKGLQLVVPAQVTRTHKSDVQEEIEEEVDVVMEEEQEVEKEVEEEVTDTEAM